MVVLSEEEYQEIVNYVTISYNLIQLHETQHKDTNSSSASDVMTEDQVLELKQLIVTSAELVRNSEREKESMLQNIRDQTGKSVNLGAGNSEQFLGTGTVDVTPARKKPWHPTMEQLNVLLSNYKAHCKPKREKVETIVEALTGEVTYEQWFQNRRFRGKGKKHDVGASKLTNVPKFDDHEGKKHDVGTSGAKLDDHKGKKHDDGANQLTVGFDDPPDFSEFDDLLARFIAGQHSNKDTNP